MKNTIIAALLFVATLTMTSPTFAHDAKEIEELRRAIVLLAYIREACDNADAHQARRGDMLNFEATARLHGENETARDAKRDANTHKAKSDEWEERCEEKNDELLHIADKWAAESPSIK